mgnify:CR=1 FL=1
MFRSRERVDLFLPRAVLCAVLLINPDLHRTLLQQTLAFLLVRLQSQLFRTCVPALCLKNSECSCRPPAREGEQSFAMGDWDFF